MIKAVIDNEMLSRIIAIENRKGALSNMSLSKTVSNRLRKNTMKRSSYASNHIEGNPLTEDQVSGAIDSSERHFLKPEQEVRNYYLAIEMLEKELAEKTPFSVDLILKAQKQIVAGESAEKTGIRGAMPPGFLFAVYDSRTGAAEYIPPEHTDIRPLLDELVEYVSTSDDHPIIKAATVHYQMVTIHPFEDGNGRTARLMSGYVLDYYGYGFRQIGTIDEYFAYDIDEYYRSLQMDLPALYYEGRENPPHPEVWYHYFLRMMDLYTAKALETADRESIEAQRYSLEHLTRPEREFLQYLDSNGIRTFRPVDIAKAMDVTNKTVTNWAAGLCRQGILKPNIAKQRIVSYSRPDKESQ